MSGQAFTIDIPIRFGHCDPAGIVFYPRYFEMFNNVVEDWCEQGLGLSFRAMHLEQGLGVPTVHVETDFIAPSGLGEVLRARLQVRELGSTSMTLSLELLGPDDSPRVRATLVLVMMDLKSRRAVRIAEPLRQRIEVYRIGPPGETHVPDARPS